MHEARWWGDERAMTESQQHVERIADAAGRRGLRVATAESLTSGLISSRLGAGPQASEWFCGGVVSYRPEVKFEVLDVPEGPLVTPETAEAMVRGVARLLAAPAAVAVTGVGGPDPEEGEPPGTVYVGVLVEDELTIHRLDLAGDDPDRILHETADRALRLLAEGMTGEGSEDDDADDEHRAENEEPEEDDAGGA